jgi:hypothetical protein
VDVASLMRVEGMTKSALIEYGVSFLNEKLTSPYVPKKKKKEKILVVFFRDRYFRFITMKYTRIVLIPVFIAIVCMFGYYASTLVPDNENVSKTTFRCVSDFFVIL